MGQKCWGLQGARFGRGDTDLTFVIVPCLWALFRLAGVGFSRFSMYRYHPCFDMSVFSWSIVYHAVPGDDLSGTGRSCVGLLKKANLKRRRLLVADC